MYNPSPPSLIRHSIEPSLLNPMSQDSHRLSEKQSAKSALQVLDFVKAEHRANRKMKEHKKQEELEQFNKRKIYGKFVKATILPPLEVDDRSADVF